jgi:uncharacterized repeat protein (TIGR03833 family)
MNKKIYQLKSGYNNPIDRHLISFIRDHTIIILLSGNNRETIKIGSTVRVIKKSDQKTGKISEGIVKEILTKSKFHPHGIKVILEDGIIGRVKELVSVSNNIDVSKEKHL